MAYTNSTPITIPDQGKASPYPSDISVQGRSGRITDVAVTLSQFSHTAPEDVDVLLVSPDGEASVVMSDPCGRQPVRSPGWIFTELAASTMKSPCGALFYRPTNDFNVFGTDAWPTAPPGPHSASFDHFLGGQPNGVWRLYVMDDDGFAPGTGKFNGGWALQITTQPADVVLPANRATGAAGPYPATRAVGGLEGVIKDVDVSLRGVHHQRGGDIGLLLVGPGGQNALLMKDNCGFDPVKGANWRWDDEAAASLPFGSCVSGTYKPAGERTGVVLPDPAPAGPYGTSLAALDGSDPNGDWRLYAFDDSPSGAEGLFVEPFELTIETRPKAAATLNRGALELVEGGEGELLLRRDAGGQRLGGGKVTVTMTPLSATAGSDFEPVSTTLELSPGQDEAIIPVLTIADALPEDPEAFEVTISQPTGDVALASPTKALVTIRDDDARPGSGGSEADRSAPETTIVKAPKRRTVRRSASVRFVASEPGARFECRLDRRAFKPCASPRKLKRLRPGRHRFAVRAIDAAGNVDPTPATRRWRVAR